MDAVPGGRRGGDGHRHRIGGGRLRVVSRRETHGSRGRGPDPGPTGGRKGREKAREPAAVGDHAPPVQARLRGLSRQSADPPPRARRRLEKDNPDHLGGLRRHRARLVAGRHADRVHQQPVGGPRQQLQHRHLGGGRRHHRQGPDSDPGHHQPRGRRLAGVFTRRYADRPRGHHGRRRQRLRHQPPRGGPRRRRRGDRPHPLPRPQRLLPRVLDRRQVGAGGGGGRRRAVPRPGAGRRQPARAGDRRRAIGGRVRYRRRRPHRGHGLRTAPATRGLHARPRRARADHPHQRHGAGQDPTR